MLSYKHGYHAGNQADVFKHICLIQTYKSLKIHHKSIIYVDTHAGNGLYKFDSEYMSKNKEYVQGVKKLENLDHNDRSIKYYLKILRKINNSKNLIFYPGSPYIMSYLTDNLDKLTFYELHNNEYNLLRKNLSKKINSKFINKDGFSFIDHKHNNDKNTLVLIDPSYEIKEDFDQVVNTIKEINNLYSKITALIWYPILDVSNNDIFIDNIRKIGSNKITRIELPLKKYNDDIGMKGSGIILINGSRNLINNIKDCLKELYKIFKDEDCYIKPKIQNL